MNIVILLAAGSGTRMKSNTSKQLMEINGLPLFMYSLKTFNENKNIDAILVVTKKEDIELVKETAGNHHITKLINVIEGGQTRQESVDNGLNYLKNKIKGCDTILIHDSARPLVDNDIIDRNIEASQKYDAVETAIKATDTIIQSASGLNEGHLNRDTIYQAQTPQTFKYSLILKAHEQAKEKNFQATDDASLVISLGEEVHIVEGSKNNFKVTTSEDLKLLKALLKSDLD